ncbi:MAG: hypothetical protein NC112_07590 [Oxalobacter formigenes]|nr:hypothetical protein [Oxalobacter formigenes]
MNRKIRIADLKRSDVADYLDSDEAIREYFRQVMEEGDTEVFVSMKPVPPGKTQHIIEDYIGALSGSAAFTEDAVQIQRAMREEW